MTRTEWGLHYRELLGGSLSINAVSEKLLLGKIDVAMQNALEEILIQTNRVYKLKELLKDYVPKKDK